MPKIKISTWMHGRWRIALSGVCLVLTIAVMLQAWHFRPRNDGTLDRVRASGILRVGMDASFPPFSNFVDGNPAGLDVDLANEVAKRLGAKVQIVNMGFDGLYYGLQTNQADVLISALPFDPLQFGDVIFTRPYINAGLVLVSRQYHAMTELDGHTVAVEYGSSGDETARLWERRLHSLTITHFTSSDDALTAVTDGKVDAALVDAITARLYLHHHADLSSTLVTYDGYVMAVRNHSWDLAGEVNRILDDMEQDGTLEAIINRWL